MWSWGRPAPPVRARPGGLTSAALVNGPLGECVVWAASWARSPRLAAGVWVGPAHPPFFCLLETHKGWSDPCLPLAPNRRPPAATRTLSPPCVSPSSTLPIVCDADDDAHPIAAPSVAFLVPPHHHGIRFCRLGCPRLCRHHGPRHLPVRPVYLAFDSNGRCIALCCMARTRCSRYTWTLADGLSRPMGAVWCCRNGETSAGETSGDWDY